MLLCTQRVARQLVTAGAARQHHLAHIDRRRTCRTGLRGIRGGQSRRHQLHQDRGARTGAARYPGQRDSARHHPDRRAGAAQRRGSHGRGGQQSCRWAALVMSTKSPVPQFFWRLKCRAISPGRRSMSTAVPTPPAAGITTRRPGTTSSDLASAQSGFESLSDAGESLFQLRLVDDAAGEERMSQRNQLVLGIGQAGVEGC